MTIMRNLRDAQYARFAALDPLLPGTAPTPDGDTLTAALPDGRLVPGILLHTVNEPGSVTSLWSARDTWELFPVVGGAAAVGVDALLRVWRARMDQFDVPTTDSATVVTWPSRDVEVSQTLLHHGLVPLSVLAVRPPDPVPRTRASESSAIRIRRARLTDLDVAVRISLIELAYSAMSGSTLMRSDAVELKRRSLGCHITAGDPVWIAELEGVPVGLAETWLTHADPESTRRFPVPVGRWGFVNAVSVLPEARGAGVGQRLMAVAHRALLRAGALGSYLYYNPPNPLSTVFWHRQGYRPLWTVWEVRPATALR